MNWLGVNGIDDRLPGVCYNGKLVCKYMLPDELQSYNKDVLSRMLNGVTKKKGPDYKECWIYMWVVPSESNKRGKLVVKIGGARESVWDRNSMEQSDACEAMIMVIPSTHWDSYYHNLLQKGCVDGITWIKDNNRHEERYVVEDDKSLEGLFAWLETNNGVRISYRKSRPLYSDSYGVMNETMSDSNGKKVKGEYASIVWELPPRWGKTMAGLCFINSLNVKFAFMTSYISTVAKSWASAIMKTSGLENIMYVYPDDIKDDAEEQDVFDKMVEHYYASPFNKIVFYVSLTGTAIMDKNGELIDNPNKEEVKNYERRIALSKKFFKKIGECKTIVMVDEADFGAKCKMQRSKLRNLAKFGKCIATICMTGTNAESTKKIFKDDGCDIYVRRTIPDMWAEVAKNKKISE